MSLFCKIEGFPFVFFPDRRHYPYFPGSLFSAYYMITAAMQLAGAALFNTVYQVTLGTFHGLVFILCAVLVLIPFTLVR